MQKELISLARIAGDAIRAVYERGTWETTFKADESPLTEADRASHQILCEGLTKLEPGVPILSEESDEIPYEIRKNWSGYYLVDPLDGTREFEARIPEFAINIAFIEGGAPVMGLIYSPLERTALFAQKNCGLFKITQSETAPVIFSNERASLSLLLSHTDSSPGLDRLLAKTPDPVITRMGSSLKFCAIAESKADFYPRLKPSMEWDTAAGTILIQEAGGLMCQLNGRPIEYNRQDMLNPPFFAMAKSLFEKLPDWQERFFNPME